MAAGTIIGGPVGDRFGRKLVIWCSILGVLPFTLALPYANLFWTGVLSAVIGFILASAFSAILVYAQELVPGKVGMISGLFFGLAFGTAGIGAAALGRLADHTSIEYVYHLCSYLPALGLLTAWLPNVEAGPTRARAGRCRRRRRRRRTLELRPPWPTTCRAAPSSSPAPIRVSAGPWSRRWPRAAATWSLPRGRRSGPARCSTASGAASVGRRRVPPGGRLGSGLGAAGGGDATSRPGGRSTCWSTTPGSAAPSGLSADGFDLTYATNHIGPFLLTSLLLPAIERAPQGRIVNVSSIGHMQVKRIDWTLLERRTEPRKSGFADYAATKLMNILHAKELARRLADTRVTTYALHPGGVKSNIWRALPGRCSGASSCS